MIIADTNVVSELMRPEPAPAVLTWADSLGRAPVAITAITVQEIEFGLARLASGRRRTELSVAWNRLLKAFAEDVIPYDRNAAGRTARVLSERTQQGRTMSLVDAQIAGICLSRNAALATRTVSDFDGVVDLEVLNPLRVNRRNRGQARPDRRSP